MSSFQDKNEPIICIVALSKVIPMEHNLHEHQNPTIVI